MKKSELKELIKECYSGIIEEGVLDGIKKIIYKQFNDRKYFDMLSKEYQDKALKAWQNAEKFKWGDLNQREIHKEEFKALSEISKYYAMKSGKTKEDSSFMKRVEKSYALHYTKDDWKKRSND